MFACCWGLESCTPLNTVVTAAVAVGFMLSIDWRLTLVSLLPMPIVSRWRCGKLAEESMRLTEESQEKLADLSARVQESMAGVRVVKAFSQEGQEIEDFRHLNEEPCGEEQPAQSRDQCLLPADAVRDRTGHCHHPLVWRPGGCSGDDLPRDSSFSSSSTWARWPGR